jgi:hypothetical protein
MIGNVLNINDFLTGSSLEYVNTNISKIADVINNPTTATFTSTSFLPAPSFLPATSVDNFSFYINGQYIPNSLLTFIESGNNAVVTFNTEQIGYRLDLDDEIEAIGKFQ